MSSFQRELQHRQGTFLPPSWRNETWRGCVAMLLILWGGPVYGQQRESCRAMADVPAARAYSRTELRQDLDVLRRALVEGDPGVYRYTSPSAFQRAFDRARSEIDGDMTLVRFYRIAAPLLAVIRDGHANLTMPDSMQAAWRATELVLPLVVHVRHGRAFIFRDLSDARESAAGRVIESINGVAASQLIALFLRATSGDGDVVSSRELDVGGLTFARDVNLLAGLCAPFTVIVSGPGSESPATLHLAGASRDALHELWLSRHPNDLELRTVRPPSEFRLVDEGHTAVLVLPGWGSSQADADQRDLRGLFKRVFATLRDSNTQTLIIDVRNNGGGEDEPARILYSYIALRPFRWYDQIIVNDTARYSFAKYIVEPDPFDTAMLRRRADGRFDLVGESSLNKLFEPAEQPFRGRVIALMNGGSFSTSTEFVAQLKANRRAELIGDESGGAFQGNDSGLEPVLALPNTGLRLRLPLAAYYLAVRKHASDRRGVMPDIPVRPTLRDEQAGTDVVMSAALALARRPPTRTPR